MRYKVTFWRSDAMAAEFGEGQRTFEVSDGVQLTYSELRETENGETLAHFEGGEWRVYDSAAYKAERYSDVSIVAA
jgi:hypothetical protein